MEMTTDRLTAGPRVPLRQMSNVGCRPHSSKRMELGEGLTTYLQGEKLEEK